MTTSTMGYRSIIIRSVTFLAGVYFFLDFILPKSATEALGMVKNNEAITNGFTVVGAMAFGLGLISIAQVHGSRIAFARKGWTNSLALMIGLVATMTVTVLSWLQNLEISRETQKLATLADFAEKLPKNEVFGTPSVSELSARVSLLRDAVRNQLSIASAHVLPSDDSEKIYIEQLQALIANATGKLEAVETQLTNPGTESGSEKLTAALFELAPALREVGAADGKLLRFRQEKNLAARLYRLLFDGIFVSLGSAMFSLLGLYIAAAAYRAFRVKSIESSLMMTAAVLVMLGQIVFGEYLYTEMPSIRQWLLEVPNSAAFRAIRIGAALAGLLIGIRMWLGIESEDFSKSA